MGPRHSKRSLDMAGTPTKGEIGVGNVGKLEKIVDGIVEKVSANGHVDGEIQNGSGTLQNGAETVQNGEASVVSLNLSVEKMKLDEKDLEEAVSEPNGEMDQHATGDADEKIADSEGKEEKKDKKKEKKEKIVKKKFSFRSFSFSKKDKSKPPKEEKLADLKSKTEVEETPDAVAEKVEELEEQSKEVIQAGLNEAEISVKEILVEDKEKDKALTVSSPVTVMSACIEDTSKPEILTETLFEKTASDELPPPLPASPPPMELKDKIAAEKEEILAETSPEVGSVSSDTTKEVLAATENIEEKATDLLKALEKKVHESKKNEIDMVSVEMTNADETVEIVRNSFEGEVKTEPEEAGEPSETLEPDLASTPLTENAPDKQEEFGAGESLAEIDIAETAPNANEEVQAAE